MIEYAHEAPDKLWLNFKAAVSAAGLIPHYCHPLHWQIKGGTKYQLVNCWVNTQRGFRFKAEGGPPVRRGIVADAIRFAGAPPVKPAEPPWGEETESILQTIRDSDSSLGLIHRFWRWLW